MAINAKVEDRLYNAKYSQALTAVMRQREEDEVKPTDEEVALIEALSRMLGNPGWFEGDFSVIVDAAVSTLTTKPTE